MAAYSPLYPQFRGANDNVPEPRRAVVHLATTEQAHVFQRYDGIKVLNCAVFLLPFLLAACGGGGASSSADKPAPAPTTNGPSPGSTPIPPVTTSPPPQTNPPPETGAARYFAYAANFGEGTVSILSVLTTGHMLDNGSVSSGAGTSSVAVDPAGKFLYAANQNSGTISAYVINAKTGALTSVAGAPFLAGGAPFCVTTDPSGKFAYVANRSTNNVSAFTIEANGGLKQVAGSPFSTGNGSRLGSISVVVDPSGKFVFVANEGDRTEPTLFPGGVASFSIEPSTGALTAVQGSPFTAGTNPVFVTVDPSGQFVYVANETSNDVSVLKINAAGVLAAVATVPITEGTTPVRVAIDPSGKFAYVANRTSASVSAFTVEPTGQLTPVPGSFATGFGPFSVTVDAAGQFAYTADQDSDTISGFTINPGTGALTVLGKLQLRSNIEPVSLAFTRVAP